MRPSAEIRPPGIYPAIAEPVRAPLEVADTRVVGFVGMTQKGPVDEPQRISNWDEFCEVYGYTKDHYLSDTVEAFFRNGGKTCFVVRVAHMARDGAEPTADHAYAAERVIPDDWNKPSMRVRALNEGRWGNDIWVKCIHTTGATALVTRDLDIGAGEADLSTTRGFEVGQLIRIYDRENSDFIIITDVDEGEKKIRWSAETPVNRRHRAAAPTQAEVMEFELHVALRERREVFKKLQMHPTSRHYAPRVVGQRSRLIVVEDLFAKSPPPHNLPEPEPLQKLSSGRDGVEDITPEDFIGINHGPAERSGLMSLTAVDEVALLACPDAMGFCDRQPGPLGEMKAQRIQDAMVDLAENLKDRFVILDCPRTRDVELVKRWRQRTDSSYAAYYWPWIEIANQDGVKRDLPPSGIMAGIYAFQETEHGVHHAPANVAVVGGSDLDLRVTEDHLGDINAEGVNSFRVQRGVRPWGARTASSDPDWRYINVRRMFIMLRRSIEGGMSWVPYEPNSHDTWTKVQDAVTEFLHGLFRKGMFAGGNPEESFYVKCDEETNPPDEVELGKLICNIGIAPVIPAEYIIIQVIQDVGGGE